MSKKITRVAVSIVAMIALFGIIAQFGCARPSDAAAELPSGINTLKIHGTWDMLPLANAIAVYSQGDPSAGAPFLYSSSSLEDLKLGKCDAVFLGREPDSGELEGLKLYTIGYDAICILIDENSFMGGERQADSSVGGAGYKTQGLKELSGDDLEGIYSFWLRQPDQLWQWSGEYYRWEAISRSWSQETAPIQNYFYFPAGKYDTQSVLYTSLGLDEAQIVEKANKSTSPALNTEEQVLAVEYKPGRPYKDGSPNFVFKIGFSSRRVAQIAMRHVPLRVLSIEGIDPLENNEAIYNGTYMFQRKIYLITAEESPDSINKFTIWLTSEGGQQIIADAGFLPLPLNSQ